MNNSSEESVLNISNILEIFFNVHLVYRLLIIY